MATVVLVGTFDTKGAEGGWLREQLEAAGCSVTSVDVGSSPADVPAAGVAARSDLTTTELADDLVGGVLPAGPLEEQIAPRHPPEDMMLSACRCEQ